MSFLALDRVFTANMTGNLVLLAVAVAAGSPARLLRHAASLVAFALGALAAGAAAARSQRPRAVLAGELALLAGLAVAWNVAGAAPPAPALVALIVLAGAAMGVQSAAVQRLMPKAPSTTYQTGTLTSLMGNLVPAGGGDGVRPRPRLATVAALVVGATAGALLALDAFRLAPVLPIVLVAAAVLRRPMRRGRA